MPLTNGPTATMPFYSTTSGHEAALAELREIVDELRGDLAAIRPVFDEWVPPDEACRILAITRDTLIRLERDGLLVPARVSSRLVRYSRNDLNALMTRCKGGAE